MIDVQPTLYSDAAMQQDAALRTNRLMAARLLVGARNYKLFLLATSKDRLFMEYPLKDELFPMIRSPACNAASL